MAGPSAPQRRPAGSRGGPPDGRPTHQTVNVPPHVTPGPGPDYGETAAYRDLRAGPQHVWVLTDSGRNPGLAVEWRKPDQLPWEGRVVHLRREDDRWVAVEEWLPVGCLERPS